MQHDGFPSEAGLHDLEFPLADGARLRYTLYLPRPRPELGGAPLALILHYGGSPVGYYGRDLLEDLMVPAWQTLAPVMVAPVTRGGDWSSAANRQALRALLAALEAAFSTDPHRRVIAGYSMGAIGTWQLLAQYPAYFSAAVPIAGWPPEMPGDCTTPLRALHSRSDQLFPLATLEARIAALAERGCPVSLTVLEDIDHYAFPAFIDAVTAVVPWLQSVWNAQRNEGVS